MLGRALHSGLHNKASIMASCDASQLHDMITCDLDMIYCVICSYDVTSADFENSL